MQGQNTVSTLASGNASRSLAVARSFASTHRDGDQAKIPPLGICAISVRKSFPSRNDVLDQAEKLGGLRWIGDEGPHPVLEISPGSLRIAAPNLARRERSVNLRADAPSVEESRRASESVRGHICSWSAKSRARMLERFSQLDYSNWLVEGARAAMVTLTYPRRWWALAPDAVTAKKHFTAILKRICRAWGIDLKLLWKLEFQNRGAPHYHILMTPPEGRAQIGRKGPELSFEEWLAVAWADVIGAEAQDYAAVLAHGVSVDIDEGMTDPRRVAAYFAKHGAYGEKEYQNRPPKLWREQGSIGRLWGYRGLQLARGLVSLDPAEAIKVARTLRRFSRSVRKVDVRTGQVRTEPALMQRKRVRRSVRADGTVREQWRTQTMRVRRCRTGVFGAGFATCPDGIRMSASISRLLWTEPSEPTVGLRGSLRERGLV